jgi:hypothetical protein
MAINKDIFVNIETKLFFMKQIYNSFFWFSLIMINLLLTSCQEKEVYPIPNVPVSLILNLDLPAYQSLNAPGGWVYINGGSKGIIVYRNFDEFVALDRHSTYEPESDCAIASVDAINFFVLNDSCSASQYNIVDGTVVTGPAKWGLKRYSSNWDGAYTVHIFN